MATKEDVEAYLIDMDNPFEEIGENMWMLHDEYDNIDNIMVHLCPPLITFRVKLMNVSDEQEKRAGLFEELLRLNATDMVHGAYGVDGDSVIIIDTLQSENLDYNEFQASVDSLVFGISTHYPILKKYRTKKE